MHILKLSSLKRNILIFALVGFTYFIELTLLSRPSDGLHSILLTLALAMVTMYLSEYKDGYGIFLGFFIIGLIDNLIYFNLSFDLAFMIAFFTAFSYVAACILFKYFLSYSNKPVPIDFKSSLVFLFTMLLSINIATILPTIIFGDIIHSINPVDVYVNDMLAGISGFLTFGLVVLFDNWLEFKQKQTFKESLVFIITAVVYSLFLILVFSNQIEWVTTNLGYSIIIVFYLAFSYQYQFKALFIFNFLYIVISRVIYFDFIVEVETTLDIAGFDILLSILTFIFIVTKLFVNYLERQNNELEEANDKLEMLLDSTMSLIKLSDEIDMEKSDYKAVYLKNVFKVACKIFSNYDYATLLIKEEKALRFIDAYQFDFNQISGIKLPPIVFEWDILKPGKITKPKEFTERLSKNQKLAILDHMPKSKEGIYIVIGTQSDPIGVITFSIKEHSKNRFTKEDISNITSFQHTVNSIFDVTELNNRTNTLKDEVVLSLVRTIELFDTYTGGHSEQVAFLSFQLALEMKLPQKEAVEVYWAGIVHDIGKIGVGYDIINKKGKLTAEEYEAVKLHPVYGYDILIKSNELRDIASLVKHHHEWYNGSGYPDGLKNSEIPLGAQILSVADAVSSMSTSRPYNKIKKQEQIIKELTLYSDSQFNPSVVKVMIKLIKNGMIEESLT